MAEGWAMQFKPGALENLTTGDRIYAAPFHITLVSLWINRPLFEETGIDLTRLATWDGFLGVVRELRDAGVTPLAVGGAERWPLQFYWGALAHRIGGRGAFDAAMAGEGAGFAGPAFVKAGRMLRELVESDPFPSDWLDATPQDSWDAFAAGETAMILAGSWALPRMTRMWPGGRAHGTQDIARVDFPPRDVGHASQTLTYGMVPAWVVRRDAPDETVDFLRRLTSIEAQTMSASMGYDVPILAAADAAIVDPLLGDTADLLTRSDHHQLVYDMALGPTAGEAVNDIVVALVEGDLTPEQAAEAVRRAWDRVRTLRLPEEEEEVSPHPTLVD
jgi:raffinose/stachyose/melibiose transport system substrate-binding protein